MKITAIRTHKITTRDTDILKVIDRYIPDVPESSVLCVTSKILALCQGRVADPSKVSKDEIARQEADLYLPRSSSKYNFMLTVKDGVTVASAGIDESNGKGLYVLWPKNPQREANRIRKYLREKHKRKNLGVLVTDSHLSPLRWGTIGVALAHSGFDALNNYIGTKDVFGAPLKMTKASVGDGLAAASVLVMGEGAEQTPLALIEEVPFVRFRAKNPTAKEVQALRIELEDDAFAPLLTSVKWRKGGSIDKT